MNIMKEAKEDVHSRKRSCTGTKAQDVHVHVHVHLPNTNTQNVTPRTFTPPAPLPVRVLQEFPKFHRSVTFHRALAARTADTHPQSAVTHIARSFPLA